MTGKYVDSLKFDASIGAKKRSVVDKFINTVGGKKNCLKASYKV
jgi:hypothetical protein